MTNPDGSPNDNTATTITTVSATCESTYAAGKRCPQDYVFAHPNKTLPDNSMGTFRDECCVSVLPIMGSQ